MIKPETTLGELLKNHPYTFDVFLSNGYSYGTKEELLEKLGRETMLKTLFKVKNINGDIFINMLEQSIQSEADKSPLLSKYPDDGKIDFFGGTICPILSTFKDDLEDTINDYQKQTGKILNCYMPQGKEEKEIYDFLCKEKDIEKFPGILLTSRIDKFLSKEFFENLVDKGYFKAYWNDNVNKDFVDIGGLDPKGQITMYGTALDVWLVDNRSLGNLPEPRTWDDLLNPIYKDKIVTFAFTDGISENTVIDDISSFPHLYYYKKYGVEGVRKFARNVKTGCHGAKMARLAGSGNKDGAAIYIVSRIFAETCANENAKVVWPADGGLVMPLLMFIRKDMEEQVKPLADFIGGKKFGETCARAFTPSLHPEVNNNLPDEASMQWLGWDYIRKNDLAHLSDYVREVFLEEWKLNNR